MGLLKKPSRSECEDLVSRRGGLGCPPEPRDKSTNKWENTQVLPYGVFIIVVGTGRDLSLRVMMTETRGQARGPVPTVNNPMIGILSPLEAFSTTL